MKRGRATTLRSTPPSAALALDGLRMVQAVSVAAVTALATWAAVKLVGLSSWRYDSGAFFAQLGTQGEGRQLCAGLFSGKFLEDGRWLNHFASDLTCSVPPGAAMLVSLAAIGAFLVVVMRRVGAPPLHAGAVAALALLSPQLWDQVLWPNAVFPGFLLLPLAALVGPAMSTPGFFIVFGILCFGGLTWPYYLLPLLRIACISDDPAARVESGTVLKLSAAVLVWWIAGFLAGFAVAQGMTHLSFGDWGMQIPAWRQPSPVTDWSSLLENLHSRLTHLTGFLAEFVGHPAVAVLLVAAVVWRLVCTGGKLQRLVFPVLCGVVLLSHFAATTYHGIIIQNHSYGFAAVALVLLAFGWVPGRRPGQAIWALAYAGLALAQADSLYRDITYYTTLRSEAARHLRQAVPDAPEAYAGLAVVRGDPAGLMAAVRDETGVAPATFTRIEQARDIWPTAIAAGFDRVATPDCPETQNFCRTPFGAMADTPCMKPADPVCYLGTTPDGWAAVEIGQGGE